MQSDPSVSTPSTPSRLAQLVAQMPKPNETSGILSEVNGEAVRKAVAEMYQGGRASVTGLVGMLAEPGTGKSDSQARHALHALVMHAGALGDEHRRSLAEALGSTLADENRP